MKSKIKKDKLALLIIGWLQIIGGIAGYFGVVQMLLTVNDVNGGILLIILIGWSFFSFSIYAGSTLLLNKDKKSGIILSIINQIPQIVQWNMFGAGLSYSCGSELVLGVQGTGAEVKLKAGAILFSSNFRMSIYGDNDFLFKINLVAIAIIIILFYILRQQKNSNIRKEEVIETDETRKTSQEV